MHVSSLLSNYRILRFLVSSYFRHFAQMASFILASLTFATCRFLAKNKHNDLLWYVIV